MRRSGRLLEDFVTLAKAAELAKKSKQRIILAGRRGEVEYIALDINNRLYVREDVLRLKDANAK